MAPSPMDGASPVPPDAPMPDAGDPNAMGAPMDDPNDMGGAGAVDPAMGGDPNAMGDPSMGGDPNAMEDPTMGGDPSAMEGPSMGGAPEEGGDSTIDIINQLSDTDREAVRAYAESMLNRDESQNNEEEAPVDSGMGMGEQDPNGGAPIMESVIFTKAQIKKLNEGFGVTGDEINKDSRKPMPKKKTNNVSSKSPFNNPKFN